MLTIRLTRKGKKNQPFFRVVVVDKRKSSKAGRSTEDLGFLDPLTKRKNINKERVLYWISKGAKPSSSVHNLLVAEKIIDAKKINVSKKSKKLAEATPATAPAVVTATPAPAMAEAPKEPEAKPDKAPAETKSNEPEKPAATPKEASKSEEKPAEEKPASAEGSSVAKEEKPAS